MYQVNLVNKNENISKQSNDVKELYKFVDSNKLKIFEYYEDLALYTAKAIEELPLNQQTDQIRLIMELVEDIHTANMKEDNSEELDNCYFKLIPAISKLMYDREICKFVLKQLTKYDFGIEFQELNR